MENLSNPQSTIKFIRNHAISSKKKFGQNFLIDESVLDLILSGSKIKNEDTVLEIGPGIGTLTRALCVLSKRVIAVEIDHDLIPYLIENLSGFKNYEIINADILKLNLESELKKRGIEKVKICANLPYYITTPILMKFFKEHEAIDTITCMVQKEVAERMSASPAGKDYGSLSLLVKYFSEPEILCFVSRNCFIPRPKVDSSVVKLNIRKEPLVKVADEDIFLSFIKGIFQTRRKTILNSIRKLSLPKINVKMKDSAYLSKLLSQLNIDPQIRGENLSLEQFSMIFNILYEGSL